MLLGMITINIMPADEARILDVTKDNNHRKAYIEARDLTKKFMFDDDVYYRDDGNYTFWLYRWDSCSDRDYYQVSADFAGGPEKATLVINYHDSCGTKNPHFTCIDNILTYYTTKTVTTYPPPYYQQTITTVTVENKKNIGPNFTVTSRLKHEGCVIFCGDESTQVKKVYHFWKDDIKPVFFDFELTIDSKNVRGPVECLLLPNSIPSASAQNWYNEDVVFKINPQDIDNAGRPGGPKSSSVTGVSGIYGVAFSIYDESGKPLV
jgi:hypothetical protein